MSVCCNTYIEYGRCKYYNNRQNVNWVALYTWAKFKFNVAVKLAVEICVTLLLCDFYCENDVMRNDDNVHPLTWAHGRNLMTLILDLCVDTLHFFLGMRNCLKRISLLGLPYIVYAYCICQLCCTRDCVLSAYSLSLEVISAHHLIIIKKYKILHYSPILCNGKMVIIPRVECVTIKQWSQPSESVMGWNCLHVLGVVHSRIVDQGQVNTLRPTQNGRHFADDILKCIFLNEKVWIPIEISLKFVSKGPIDNNPALV